MFSTHRSLWMGQHNATHPTVLDYLFDYPIRSLLQKPEEELPRLVFPYAGRMNQYRAPTIIEEIKAQGLYETSSMQTSCSIYPLLEHYAFRRYGCSVSSLEMAAAVRNGRMSRESALQRLDEYRKVYQELVSKPEWTEADKAYIRQFTAKQFPQSPEDAEYLFQIIASARETAKKIGVPL